MTGAWKWLNLLVAFALELAAFAALGVWGWQAASTRVVQILLVVGLPLLAVVLWGLFAVRNPRYDVPPAAIAVKIAVFGAAVAGLWASSHHTAAVVLAAVLIANTAAIRLGHLDADA
ncbi:MAG TPA: YrdB family protein [Kribbellaceae bacterium]|nr:YrdB family protein [Kribbellaceae bacterium]